MMPCNAVCWCCRRVDMAVDRRISILPDFCSFTAVGADIDVLTTLQDLPPEINILFVVPDLFKGPALQVSQLVLGILIEAAGYDQAIPGDDGGVPEAPAMVVQAVSEFVFSLLILLIPAIF